MLEAILKKLAAIGIHLPLGGQGGITLRARGTKITGIRFSSVFRDLFHIDNSTHVDNRIIVINHEKLTSKQRNRLQSLIPTLLDDVGAIMDEKSLPTVESVVDSLPNIREIAKKFIPIIPPEDIPLLNACVFLRLKYERGEPVELMKGQIMRVYGTRGCNFANLCSAGYLESEFLPYFEQLAKAYPDDPTGVKAKFLTFYKLVLNELPWTEFVSGRSSVEKVTAHIVEKMNRNVANGVRSMNIHGLGAKNVKTVMAALPEIQSQTGAEINSLEKDKQRIFIRLEIPPKTAN